MDSVWLWTYKSCNNPVAVQGKPFWIPTDFNDYQWDWLWFVLNLIIILTYSLNLLYLCSQLNCHNCKVVGTVAQQVLAMVITFYVWIPNVANLNWMFLVKKKKRKTSSQPSYTMEIIKLFIGVCNETRLSEREVTPTLNCRYTASTLYWENQCRALRFLITVLKYCFKNRSKVTVTTKR